MGYFNIPLVLWFVFFVVNFWSKRYLQNHCPLALKIRTRHANLLKGSALHVWVIPLGGILCIFLLSDAVFLCYRDIFSVTKVTKALVIVGSCLLLCCVFSFFNLSWEIYEHLSWILLWICSDVVLVRWKRVLFCYCLFWLAFLDVFVYSCC